MTEALRDVIGDDIDLMVNLRFQPLKIVTSVTLTLFSVPSLGLQIGGEPGAEAWGMIEKNLAS